MSPEVAVVLRLEQISAVAAIVDDRIYQLHVPQRPTLPAVKVQLIDEVPAYHLRGENGLKPTRIQVDAWIAEGAVDAYTQMIALADAINGNWVEGSPAPPTGLAGWRGELGGSPPTIRIDFIRRIDRGPLYESDELRQLGVRQDYLVWWKPLLT